MSSPTVLIIAGSDSSGGAGLQRDLRVLADFKVRSVSAITAITAQTDQAVTSVSILSPDIIRDQIRAALATCPVAAVKIGMLGNAATVGVVAECLGTLRGIPIILDPVLSSSSGRVLLDEEGQRTIRVALFPMVTLLTPNIPEAAALLGGNALNEECLLNLGPQAVLLKGGHGAENQSIDVLFERGREPIRLLAPRVAASMRGTGCALSTAIAAGLAKGQTLAESCSIAKNYVLDQMQIASANSNPALVSWPRPDEPPCQTTA